MKNLKTLIKTDEINGDLKISFLKTLAWFFLNLIQNLKVTSNDEIKISFFSNKNKSKKETNTSSPGRDLVNNFNQNYLKQILEKKDAPNCLEIGCGSGSFCEKILLNSINASYTGIDICSRFKKKSTKQCRFITIDILAFKPKKKYDFIYSNSVLEHCKDDKKIFKKSYDWLNKGGTALHFLPSSSGILLYPKHGFRQYTKYSLKSKVSCNEFNIVFLGGFGSFLCHFLLITVPEIIFRVSLRKNAAFFYSNMKQFGFKLDSLLPFFGPMVAVVIKK